MDVQSEIVIKGALSLAAVVVVVWRHRRPKQLKAEQAGQLLWAMAAVSALAYINFGQFHGRSVIHHWEQFHYFLGSKYFAELRYDGLYAASLAAERELDLGRPLQSHARDLRTNEVVPVGNVLSHAREVTSRFSAARWEEFKHDTRYFLTANAYDYIARIRSDHGYNPTPTWTFSARLVSRWLKASDGSLLALAWIDPLLLAAMFWLVFRTYGSRVGCLALILFGLGYAWRFDWVGGAFLRQDWLAAVGCAICLARRGRTFGAGTLIAYATMVRVFPGGFLVGAGVLAIRELLRRHSIAWAWRLAAGFATGVVICVVFGAFAGAGSDAWPQFLANLDKHHDTWLTNNVGLKNTVLYDRATMTRQDVNWNLAEPWLIWQAKINRLQEQRQAMILVVTALLLALTAAAAWRLELDEALVLGMVVVFATVVLTCYYWVMLTLIPLGRGRWGPTAGWLAANTGLYVLHRLTPSFEMIYGLMSWALALYFVAWIAPGALATIRDIRDIRRVREAS